MVSEVSWYVGSGVAEEVSAMRKVRFVRVFDGKGDVDI